MTAKLTYEELEERIKDLEILESYNRCNQRVILEAIHDGLWEHDFKNNVFRSSDKLFTMLGYSPMNGLEGYEFLVSKIHPEDKKIFEHEQQRLITSNTKSGLCTFRLQAADGSWRYILARAKWIAANDNEIGYHYIGTHTDITALKLAEKSLIESEAKYRLIAENSGDVIFLLDMNLCYTYVSPAVYKMRGFYPEEVMNNRISDTLIPESLERVSLLIAEQLKIQEKEGYNPISIELEMLCKGGGTIWAEVKASFLRDDNGNLTGILGVSRNITERKQIEQSLYESEARFKALHNASFGGITIHDKGVILDCNQGLSEITGYSIPELIGMDGLLLIAEKSRNLVKQNILSGYEKAYEATGLRKNGEEYPICLEARNIPYKGKSVRVVEFRDITEQKQAEAKQKELEATNLRLQKAESLGQMAGGIAHLFNNYLYAVSGNLELALEKLPKDSLIYEYLDEAMKATHRCANVSGSMLYYLGHNFLQTESVDITKFCRQHLSDFQSSIHNDIALETDLMDTELIVRVNSNQMHEVLNHLITNACESIGENKGKISLITKIISASNISKLHIFLVDFKPSVNTYICLEVIDTGCGISKQDIHKISDPFFTTKFTGRGLGLAIVSGIVKSWGGMIGVKSKVGHGSSFMVFLPLFEKNSVQQPKKIHQVLEQEKSFFTVLLVEDNPAVLKITTLMLKKMGFEVISAVNGVEAVELFRQHKESVSCLITDLSMPELDGWGTLAEIRKIKPDIPAVFASGYDEAFALSRIDSEKPQAFLHKPYSMANLKSALGKALS